MKRFSNENGMALVTVLLMITVFIILGMAVISLSISNTKQVAKTEQEMQAVDVAEMGVIYYKNAFIQNAAVELKSAINRSKVAIETSNKNKVNKDPISNENILEHLTINTETFNRDYSKEIPDATSPYSFQIMHDESIYRNYILSVNFSSYGYVKRNENIDVEKQLEATINLDVEQLLLNDDIKSNYSKYKNIDGDAVFTTINGGIKNSYWDISRNAIFTTINGGIKDSYLDIVGNAVFTILMGVLRVPTYI